MKNGKIELGRFFFCLTVIMYHLARDFSVNSASLGEWFSFFKNGRCGVEFFFIVSGYLMAKAAKKRHKDKTPVGKDTVLFIWKKVKRLFIPHIIFAVMMAGYIVKTNDKPVYAVVARLSSLFWLDRTGIGSVSFTGVEWYISSMLIGMAIIYPLLRLNYDFFARAFAPIGSLLIMGYLVRTYGCLPNNSDFSGLTYDSNVRAFAVLLLGVTCYEASELIKKEELISKHKLLMIIIENVCYIVFVYYLISNFKGAYNALAALFCAAAIAITFSRDQLDFYNNKLIYFLGEISLPVYLSQNFVRKIVEMYFSDMRVREKLVIAILMCLSLGVAAHYITMLFYNFKNKMIRSNLSAG